MAIHHVALAALGLSIAATSFQSSSAEAAPIMVYSTGVDSNGTTRSNGSAETHYTLAFAPTAYSLRTATSANGFPIPPWVGDDLLSTWIGPAASADLQGLAGNYDYRTTFSLAGLDAASARIDGRWAADDTGITILINGVPVSTAVTSFSSFTNFAITSGFVSGLNTLDFLVANSGGPTGVRVELSGTANSLTAAVPELGTWAMMIVGMGAIGFAMRRRNISTRVRFA